MLLYRLMLTMTNIFRLVSVSVSRFRLNKQTRPWGNWIYLILCQTGTVVYFSVLNKYFIFQFQVLFLGFELQFEWMLLRINRITPNSFCHGDRYKILIGKRVQRKTQDTILLIFYFILEQLTLSIALYLVLYKLVC